MEGIRFIDTDTLERLLLLLLLLLLSLLLLLLLRLLTSFHERSQRNAISRPIRMTLLAQRQRFSSLHSLVVVEGGRMHTCRIATGNLIHSSHFANGSWPLLLFNKRVVNVGARRGLARQSDCD